MSDPFNPPDAVIPEDDTIKYATGSSCLAKSFGSYVCVCWNARREKKTITQGGITYTAQVPVAKGEPYISFRELRQSEDDEEEWFLDEDSTVGGGIRRSEDEKMRKELDAAVEYLRKLGH
jgi:hypothetical protein